MEPFDRVVAQHGQTVLRVCRAIVGHHDADDAWSETFLSALQAYPDLAPDANLEAWLVTIAKRKSIDQLRRTSRAPTPVDDVPERPTNLGVPTEPDDQLWSAMRSLTVLQREAIAYHHLAGMPFAQVAVLLGNSERAARRASTDGLKKLRTIYQKAPR